MQPSNVYCSHHRFPTFEARVIPLIVPGAPSPEEAASPLAAARVQADRAAQAVGQRGAAGPDAGGSSNSGAVAEATETASRDVPGDIAVKKRGLSSIP